MKRIVLLTALITWVMSLNLNGKVFAGGLDVNSGVGLGTISLPTFLSLDQIKNFSVESYIALGVSLFFLVIIGIWVVMAIRSGIDIIRSEGNPDAVATGKKRFTAIFASITILFGFIVVLTLVASFFGLGGFWQWPRMFSRCSNSAREGQFYFNVVQEYSALGLSEDGAATACFGG